MEFVKNKKCTKCKQFKSLDRFGKNKKTKDKLRSWCFECLNELSKSNSRTKKGVITTIYNSQKQNSKRRGHRPPEYTRKELQDWAFSQEIFHVLYNEWKNSGYSKMLKPSFDRKYDDIHYCFNNIQIMTWQQNKEKQTLSFMKNILPNSGYLNGGHKPVLALNDDDTIFMEFISLNDAKRHFGLKTHSNISLCCQGKRNKTAGHKWRYKDEN